MPAVTAEIPLPIQIVIDDVGWWSGEDGSARQEPFRTGFVRNHVPADYEAIASLGRQLKMRPQAAFILCEWDKQNILRELPPSTWMGQSWDNSRWVGNWQEEAAEIIRANEKYFEFTLHGVGHEYWQEVNGQWKFSRAEWCDGEGQMRPREQVLAHLEYYAKLMEQHNLGSFPTSFVPCAFRHRFEDSSEGMAAILKEWGVDFISTPFHSMHGADAVEGKRFGFQAGVITVDRGPDVQQWNCWGMPEIPELNGPICGMHWPNILHPDPERNEEVVGDWVRFLKSYEVRPDRMLAADTASFATQLAHHSLTECQPSSDGVTLDFSRYKQLPPGNSLNQVMVKIRSECDLKFSSNDAEVMSIERMCSGKKRLYTLTVITPARVLSAHVHWTRRQ